jgi:hypothetical protein
MAERWRRRTRCRRSERRRPPCRSKIARKLSAENAAAQRRKNARCPQSAAVSPAGTDHRPGRQQHQLVFGPADAGDGANGDYALHPHLANADEQTLVASRGTGGDFSPTEESFFGETASRTLREYAIDTLFFSCQGLERDSGLYAGTEAHAALLKQMMLAARQTVALVDGSKLGRTGVARIGGLGELDCLITEKFVDPLLEKEMTWHNVGLQIA